MNTNESVFCDAHNSRLPHWKILVFPSAKQTNNQVYEDFRTNVLVGRQTKTNA